MKNLNDIETWKRGFGLLPIHLLPIPQNQDIFIMLNGGYGDFCLNTQEDNKEIDYYSLAWSSNTSNFVSFDNANVLVHNWKKDRCEKIPKNQVNENLSRFYDYLVKSQNRFDDDSIIPFIIDIFKQFRNLTKEKRNAPEALNLLLVLLASIEEDTASIDFNKWGLSSIEIPQNFDSYVERLKDGFPNRKPLLDSIIRHSFGLLFQEAEKEVLFFDDQLDIWGNLSSNSTSQKILYSSVHYTPPYLVRTIVENSLREINKNKKSLKIFDPACGASEFLIEVLKQLSEERYKGSIHLIGWDTSQTAINTSKFLLSYEKRNIWKEKLTFELKPVHDSLMENWDEDYDLILMNPPFSSWEQMDKDSRDVVNSILTSNVKGRPNKASAFLYKSIQSLNGDGVIGSVIPSSLLTLDAYQKLRGEIHDLINIKLVGKLGNFIFEEALTDVSLIIGHKPKSEGIPYIIWTKNEKGVAQNALRDLRKMYYSKAFKINEKDYSIYQPISFPILHDNWKLMSFEEGELLKQLKRFTFEKKLLTVQDVFSVQQGIRTGNNSIFKLSEKEYRDLPKSEQTFFRPVIDNESISNGIILKKNYVWYPYENNEILIKTEKELERKVPIFYKKKLIQLPKDDIMWWKLNRHREWLSRKEPRLVSTEFGNSDSFAFDKEGIFAVERGNAWLPKDRDDVKDIDFYYFYLALFSSPFLDKLLSIYSKQLAGGNWYDLGKKFTSQIPIPVFNLLGLIPRCLQRLLVELGNEPVYS